MTENEPIDWIERELELLLDEDLDVTELVRWMDTLPGLSPDDVRHLAEQIRKLVDAFGPVLEQVVDVFRSIAETIGDVVLEISELFSSLTPKPSPPTFPPLSPNVAFAVPDLRMTQGPPPFFDPITRRKRP